MRPDIDAIKTRLIKADQEPWGIHGDSAFPDEAKAIGTFDHTEPVAIVSQYARPNWKANRDLIANAPQDIKDLLTYIEEMEARG